MITTSPSGRVDDLQDLLALAAPDAQRRLFEMRGYGVLQMAVKAAETTRTWLPSHLDVLVSKTATTYLEQLHRQAALALWAQVFPPRSLPSRFEGLAAEVMAAGGSGVSVAMLLTVIADA